MRVVELPIQAVEQAVIDAGVSERIFKPDNWRQRYGSGEKDCGFLFSAG